MSDEKNIDALAKEKAEEILHRQKIKELSNAVTDIVKTIPNSLRDIRQALEMLERRQETGDEKISQATILMRSSVESLHSDVNNLATKIREIFNLHENTNTEELLIGLEDRLMDKDSKTSLISIITEQFSTVNESLKDQIQKNLSIKSWITWAIASIGTIVGIIVALMRLLEK